VKQHFRIAGSANYLPKLCHASGEMDRRMGLAPGWTERHTGILHRYEARDGEDGSTMARTVVVDALADAGCTLAGVDMIIDGSLSVQQPIPANAALIQEALGPEAHGIPSIDVHASCLGFLAALQMANGLFAAEAARRIVVVCSETPFRGLNWGEPESASLMGDGAAAFVLEKQEPLNDLVIKIETFSEGAGLCVVRGGGHRLPAYTYTEPEGRHYRFHMNGKGVHKLASRLLPPMVEAALRDAGCAMEDLHIVPHQASGPAIEFIARRIGIPRDRLHSTVAEHGNLVAAGIPFVLHAIRKTLPPGQRVMLLGTAAGYTQGCAIISV
jgi:3-oxoacyl-[acyl-carrier-protein] synthase-3